jgi:hypothetical protein
VLKDLSSVGNSDWSSMDAHKKKEALQEPLANLLQKDMDLVKRILNSYPF